MGTAVYIVSAFLLIVAAFAVFRVVVRRDYRQKGRLTPLSGFLELLIWGLYMGFPYLYNPPQWVWFWSGDVPVGTPLRVSGMVCIGAGFVLAFGTMAWFGMRRAFGLEVNALIQTGPYRLTRNPQIIAGVLLVFGTAVLWPSWYAVGWVVLYAFVAHPMVLTEEEHLRVVFGEEYARYCERVPRYLPLAWRG
jgi:protein-S-isoprenylcysteine O-methyltransferase Ste14